MNLYISVLVKIVKHHQVIIDWSCVHKFNILLICVKVSSLWDNIKCPVTYLIKVVTWINTSDYLQTFIACHARQHRKNDIILIMTPEKHDKLYS